MNKNDFRIKFPLWNIALLVILMIWTYSIVYAVDIVFNDFDGVFAENGQINLSVLGLISFFAGLILLIFFFIGYFKKVNRHNKKNPGEKITAFTILKPNEFIERDELFRQVTQNATKKVYIFYSLILPLVILLMVFPFKRFVYIMVIYLLLIIQNIIYYQHIRKYIS